MADLSTLIDRLKKASASDHELDRDIWEAVTGQCTHRNTHYVELENDERELECSDCGRDTYGAETVEAALKWVREVYPSTNRESGGAVVHMTWDEFNGMRALLGLKPLKPTPVKRTKSSRPTLEED